MLARALEVNPSCVVLWVVYLHVYYSTETSIGKDDMFLFAVCCYLFCSLSFYEERGSGRPVLINFQPHLVSSPDVKT